MEREFQHTISADGLSMTSKWLGHPDGVLESNMVWLDLDTAQENYEAAKAGFEERVSRLVSLEVGERRTIRRFPTRIGTFYFHLNTGPPTWWLPNVGFRRERKDAGTESRYLLRAGWLRACFILAWHPGRKS